MCTTVFLFHTCVVRDDETVGECEIIDKSMSIHCLHANCCLYSFDIFVIICNKGILIHSEWKSIEFETLGLNQPF